MKKLMAALIPMMLTIVACVASMTFSSLPASAAACQSPATTYGSVSLNLSVPQAGTYQIWSRLKSPVSSSNSYMLQIDGTNCFTVGGSGSFPAWAWVDYQNGNTGQHIQASLTAGNNALVLIGTQPSLGIDTVLALADTSCTPAGLGTNCTTGQTPSGGTPGTPPTTGGGGASAPSGSAAQALSASGTVLTPNNSEVTLTQPVTVSPTIVPGDPIKEALYYLNKKLVATVTKAPFSYYLDTNKLMNGTYVLMSNTIYTSGASKTANETIVVKHPLLSNVAIIISNYYAYLIIFAALLGLGIWLLIKYRRDIAGWFGHFRKSAPARPPTPPEPSLVMPEAPPVEADGSPTDQKK